MATVDKIWALGGVIVLLITSSLLFTSNIPSPLVPVPVYLLLLAWAISYLSWVLPYAVTVVVPLLYFVEFKWLSNKSNFTRIVSIFAIFLSALSVAFFWSYWEYGVKYQGEAHTKIVATENIVGFICVGALIYLSKRNNSKVLLNTANLLLFLMLSWCVFPTLGELP